MLFFKRSILSIIRKPVKTFIIFSIMLVISTLLLATTNIKRATEKQSTKIEDSINSGFTFKNSMFANINSPRGIGMVPEKLVSEIEKNDKISKVNRRMIVTINMLNVKVLKPERKNEVDEQVEREYGIITTIYGESDTSLDHPFKTGVLKLVEGRHIKPDDKHKVLVHEDFAKLNNLKIGSKFKYKANTKMGENIYKSTAEVEVEVEVIGIFRGKNQQMAFSVQEMHENLAYTDLQTVRDLYKYPKGEETYHDILFYSKTSKDTDKLISEIKEKPYNWNDYEIFRNDSYTPGLTSSLNNINKIIRTMYIMTIVISIIILTLVLFMWVNDRKKEIGILIAIGKSKLEVALQFTTEIIMISVLAIILSFFAGGAVSQKIGDKVSKIAGEEATKSIRRDISGPLGSDIDSDTFLKTVDKLEVKNNPTDMVYVSMGVVFIIVLSSGASLYPLFRKKPKNLLLEQQ